MTGSQENRYRIIENENNQNSEFSENFFVHKKKIEKLLMILTKDEMKQLQKMAISIQK